MEYADFVSTLALLFALFTFGWNVIRMERWQKPVISIQHSAFIFNSDLTRDGHTTPHSWTMVTEVVNVGDVTTSITDVFWEAKLHDGKVLYIHGSQPVGGEIPVESTQFIDSDSGSIRLLGEVVPPLPINLGRNETATWHFERLIANEPLLSEATQVRAVVAYITRTGVIRRLGYSTAHVEGEWWDGPAKKQTSIQTN